MGSTVTEFKVRFRNHTLHMRTSKRACEVAKHFNDLAHAVEDFEFTIIEKLNAISDIDRRLLSREAYWTS